MYTLYVLYLSYSVASFYSIYSILVYLLLQELFLFCIIYNFETPQRAVSHFLYVQRPNKLSSHSWMGRLQRMDSHQLKNRQ